MSSRFRPRTQAGPVRIVLVYVISFLYSLPTLWIVLTALKTRVDVYAIPPKLFFTPTLDNFRAVFYRSLESGALESTGFGLYFFNSLFVSGTSVAIAVVIGTAAAYGFSRFPLKGTDTYMFIILTTRMMPPIVVIIPIFLLFRLLDLNGSYMGIILLYTAFNLPFSIWMMKSFFDELPRDVEDAARIAGASEWQVFKQICLPQVLAGISGTVVFALILTWNEFFFALMLTGADTRTVPVAMASALGGEKGVDWGVVAALEVIYIVPILLVVFFLQSQLLRGVTFGTVRK